MSIKIYMAYRTPIANVNEALKRLNAAVMANVVTRTKELCAKVVSDDNDSLTPWKKYQCVIEEFKRASTSARRDPFYCVDCTVAVYLYENYAYLIPFGESFVLKNLNIENSIEDFSYWNNTDGPDHIPYEEWSARGDVWRKVLNIPCLVYNIIHFTHDDIESHVKLQSAVWEGFTNEDYRSGRTPW